MIEEYKNPAQITTIYVYPKECNVGYECIKKKGKHWWKLFGVIPIFQYNLKEDLYHVGDFRWIFKSQVEEELKGSGSYMDDSGIVYYYPSWEIVYSDKTSETFNFLSNNLKEFQKHIDEEIKKLEENYNVKLIKKIIGD